MTLAALRLARHAGDDRGMIVAGAGGAVLVALERHYAYLSGLEQLRTRHADDGVDLLRAQ